MAASLAYSGLPRPDGLVEGYTVLDIGAGLRPMGWYTPHRHVCVEPHVPYAELLQAGGYEVWGTTAQDALEHIQPGAFDAIYMLDVIEHMTRRDGSDVLQLALAAQPKQIVIATPLGFHPQEHDAWGLGGEHWQKHRSGWTPDDFPGWTISYYDNGAAGGFVAIR